MPRVFDNIEQDLLPALEETLRLSHRSDFCVGYFNLRGWRKLDRFVETWSGIDGSCCRLLVGMHKRPEREFRQLVGAVGADQPMNNEAASRLKRQPAREFREQLAAGIPTVDDELGLRRLAAQLRAGKVVVKLFLAHPLHAKLYLCFRNDPVAPVVGFVGSSNLTVAGLREQGELNIDVLDNLACDQLCRWFEDRWSDRWCVDISEELLRILGESWASEELIPPYHVYLKMAYHLSREAISGMPGFRIPREFKDVLLEFQEKAVQMAALYLKRRKGVLIGDVVGLGKTLMATAVARIFEDEPEGFRTLILCPPNLRKMWVGYRERFGLRGRVLSIGAVVDELPRTPHYPLVIIDESQNLRNREGRRYKAIRDYIQLNKSHCILLSATPYNKSYSDLSSQLRLFIPEGQELTVRPERLIRQLGAVEFFVRHNCSPRSLDAFDKSEFADDWRELMRLYLVRRTRSFIQREYGQVDESGRPYLGFSDGRRFYLPERVPRSISVQPAGRPEDDPYCRLFSDEVVDAINTLWLPRYGLASYVAEPLSEEPTEQEQAILSDLSRAGRRLLGFCRASLFKRLESSGQVFVQSLWRHVLRNYVYLHALQTGQPLPIGTQDWVEMPSLTTDADFEQLDSLAEPLEAEASENASAGPPADDTAPPAWALPELRRLAGLVYEEYTTRQRRRFRWIRPAFFSERLAQHLQQDADRLMGILRRCGGWDPRQDAKLAALCELVLSRHRNDKVLVFTQYADTVRYLVGELRRLGVDHIEGATGDSGDPTALARRFSPVSNDWRDRVQLEDEIRVLVTTDVLSEGQNLQDCAIVVNYDLPWAIIRLTQRVGRVDRIGQAAPKILCYSFMPAEGVEQLIRLRQRLVQRLHQNAEVVGSDEEFFGTPDDQTQMVDLYNEKAGALDDPREEEVDLVSKALSIWNRATRDNRELRTKIENMPDVVHSSRAHAPSAGAPRGAIVFVKTAQDNDSLLWVDGKGEVVSESEYAILEAAACEPDTIALPRAANHYDLVRSAVEYVGKEEAQEGGQLGQRTAARYRTYQRLMQYARDNSGTLFVTPQLNAAIDAIYRYPLRESAKDTLNRQFRLGIADEDLVQLVTSLHADGRLCVVPENAGAPDRAPRIICSMGMLAAEEARR